MNIKKFNGLNIIVDKKLELMLAILAVYLKKHPSEKEKLDFIETPPVDYLDELELIFGSTDYEKLVEKILKFEDESTCVELALSLDDKYELDENRAQLEKLSKYLGGVDLESFLEELKTFAQKIKWDDFFNDHTSFYVSLLSKFCDFPKELDLSDIQRFYGKKSTSYNYIPSILMNGGFGFSDKLDNLYYIRGIVWHQEKKEFYYDKEYLLECLFHEFSHPFINPLVDKYISSFINLDKLYRFSLEHMLPKTYSNMRILLYEYFVRVNANILTRKYYQNARFSDWILEHGFPFLLEIMDHTIEKMPNYKNYEEFFIEDMIPFINDLSYGLDTATKNFESSGNMPK